MKERVGAWVVALIVLFLSFGFLGWRTGNVINSSSSERVMSWDISSFLMGAIILLIVFVLMNIILSKERR